MNFDKLIGENHYRGKDGICIASPLQKAASVISGLGSGAAIAAIAITNPVVKHAFEAALNRQEYLIQLCSLSKLSLQDVIKKMEELPYDPYSILAYYREWGKFPEWPIENYQLSIIHSQLSIETRLTEYLGQSKIMM